MALSALSAAGSVAGIGSFLLDGWNVKGRAEKKSTKLDRLLGETGNNLQLASKTVEENEDVLEPVVMADVLQQVEASSIKHKKNVERQGLAHEGKLSRAEKKDYEGSVKQNMKTSNNVLLRAQVDSQLARTKLLLSHAQAAQGAHGHSQMVPQTVVVAHQAPASVHLKSSSESGSYAVDPPTENSESVQPDEDPFVDPTSHTQGAVAVPLEIELQSMTLQGSI